MKPYLQLITNAETESLESHIYTITSSELLLIRLKMCKQTLILYIDTEKYFPCVHTNSFGMLTKSYDLRHLQL